MTQGQGFFISPRGKIIMVATTHLRSVMKNPEAFGLSRDYVELTQRRHRRKTGLMGNTRDEILRAVLRNGWIRLRRHTNKYWSVQPGTVTEERIRFVRRWAQGIVNGSCGYTENDPFMPVKAEGLEDGFRQESTVTDLASAR